MNKAIHSKALPYLTLAALFGWMSITACSSAHEEGHDHGAKTDAEVVEDSGSHGGHDHGEHAHSAAGSAESGEASAAFVGDAYPLSFCVVSGDSLDAMGGPVTFVYEGRQIQFCCENCKGTFLADPATYLKKIDEEIVEQQMDLYPLQTCMVSGEELGAMGPAVDIVVGNRLVRLCCSGCEKAVRANPDKFIGQLNKAAADYQRANYPMDTCVVSGDKLGGAMGESVDVIFGGRLVRLCCENCVDPFYATPQAYLKKLDEAAGSGS